MTIQQGSKQIRAGAALIGMLLLLSMFAMTAMAAIQVPEPAELFYVADYADVLSADTVSHIVSQNDALYDATGAQIVVATVDFLDGHDIEEYAWKMFNEWGVGSKEKNNGVLLLLAIGEDNYWAVQGKGLEDILTSGDLGDLLYDYLEEDFANQDYDAGVYKVFDAMLQRLQRYYGIGETDSSQPIILPPAGGTVDPIPPSEHSGVGFFRIFPVILIVIVVVLVIVLSALAPVRRRPYYGPTYYPRRGFYPRRRRPPFMGPPPPPGGGMHPPHSGDTPPFHGGDIFGDFFGGGGSTRGGGAGRSSFSGSSRSSSRSSGRSSSFGSRSGGGGSSRGGGAGRRR